MDRVAEHLLGGDASERAMWMAVLVRAAELVEERDVRQARLVAHALAGG